MPRLGHFTGTVYADDYDFSTCPECCLVLKDGQAEDEAFIQRTRVLQKLACEECNGCPAAKEGMR